jgi:hypothetical protein
MTVTRSSPHRQRRVKPRQNRVSRRQQKVVVGEDGSRASRTCPRSHDRNRSRSRHRVVLVGHWCDESAKELLGDKTAVTPKIGALAARAISATSSFRLCRNTIHDPRQQETLPLSMVRFMRGAERPT